MHSTSHILYSIVDNCDNSGKITCNGYTRQSYSYDGYVDVSHNSVCIGGILGYAIMTKVSNTNNTNIIECLTNIDSPSSIGGIVGELRNGNIYNSCNNGEIKGNVGVNAGGILGGGFYNININNCYNTKNVTTNTVAGGIVGSAIQANIKYCYNVGQINAMSGCGGIVGAQKPFYSNDYTGNSMWYCYNIGNIVENSSSSGTVGGEVKSYSADFVYGLSGTSSKLIGVAVNYKGDGIHYGMLNKSDLISMILTNYGSNFKADTLNKNNGYPILSFE